MIRKYLTVTNSFHNTSARAAVSTVDALRYGADARAQRRAVKRLRSKLCGASGCACGVVR